MIENNIRQRTETKRFNPEIKINMILSKLGKIGGERQFSEKNSLDWTKLNRDVEFFIKDTIRFGENPKEIIDIFWDKFRNKASHSKIFNSNDEFENYKVGILAEVAIEKSLSLISIDASYASPERDVEDGCDVLINPGNKNEICCQIKTTRDTNRNRKSDVRFDLSDSGTRAMLEMNYQDGIDIFYDSSTGEPTEILKDLLSKELRNSNLLN
ncbi:hypothetical protein GYA13_04600 [Candidatus Kuenenbacteria bacterium]|nr:hypothetical protein [Candidatus Kuenenbacteria bacterium]